MVVRSYLGCGGRYMYGTGVFFFSFLYHYLHAAYTMASHGAGVIEN